MKKNNSQSTKGAALCLALVLGCANSVAQATDLDVRIDFDTDKCPQTATPELGDLTASGANKILWTAYNHEGNADSSLSFQIFFDPFRGQPLVSQNGVKKSPPLSTMTPKNSRKPGGAPLGHVIFKYTVVGQDCVSDVSLDPRIKVF